MDSLERLFALPLERWIALEYVKTLEEVRRSIYLCAGGRYRTTIHAVNTLAIAERLALRRCGSMAKRDNNGTFEFQGWINIRLNDEHKAELEHLAKDYRIEELLAWLAGLMFDGYSFSMAWDDWSDSQQVTLVCKSPGDVNYGYGMSARHPDFDMALLSLRYKHSVIANGDWQSVAPYSKGNAWG